MAGFAVLIIISVKAYKDSPPIPEKVVNAAGDTIFTGEDILAGQQVFLKYGLMENGTVWGHGAYLGPDFSAAYLHRLAEDVGEDVSRQRYQQGLEALEPAERQAVEAETRQLLKKNRFDPQTKTLLFTKAEENSYRSQITRWQNHFSQESRNGGLPPKYLSNQQELEHLTAFFAWTAWAAAASRPNKSYSYTSNFPYDPLAGNTPPSAAILWSALSLITLLGRTGHVLWFQLIPIATDKYFADVAFAAGDILDRHLLYRRRSDACLIAGQKRTEAPDKRHSPPFLGVGCGGRRKSAGRAVRYQSTPG
jgi:nitric oxide reductase subunit B